jgi:hypothetical protein
MSDIQRARRGSARAALAAAGVVAVVPAAALALTRPTTPANVTRLAATVAGRALTVTGNVRLSPDTAAVQRRAKVVLQLNGRDHAWERRTVPIAARGAYRERWTTELTGRLTLTSRATVSGKPSGSQRSLKVVVTPPSTTTTPTGPSTTTPTTTQTGQPMLGLFKLTAGAAPNGGTATGSYVEMLTGSGTPLPNPTSPAANKSYTTFRPGVDGGLSTVAYEPAPLPAFAKTTSGNALADEIVQPVPFEGTDFSIDTNSSDVETGQADPIPQIYNSNGVLSGQITAWDAQWNGQSFNQGSPKPDGSSPAPTTTVTGTYDASSGAFTLTWRSRIVGGPFNGFSGLWHLAGTFVPATP